MRKIIMYCIFAFMLLLVIASCITIHSRNTREDELQQSLDEAADATINAIFKDKTYTIANKDEFIADFLEGLLVNISSSSKITVNILKADEEKGLLSVEVIETYKHLNGNTGTVSVSRNIVFDRSEKKEDVYHDINFLVNGEKYKSYQLLEGDPLLIPKDPDPENSKTFDFWYCRETGSKVAANQKVDRDYNFEAHYK